MGKRNTECEGKSGKSRPDNFQEAKVNPVHVKIDFSDAISYGKAILNSKASLISSVRHLKYYGEFREKELDKKAELRELLHNVHVIVGMAERDLPKIKDEKEIRQKTLRKNIKEELAESEIIGEIKEPEIPAANEEPRMSAMEKELIEINQRLNALKRLA